MVGIKRPMLDSGYSMLDIFYDTFGGEDKHQIPDTNHYEVELKDGSIVLKPLVFDAAVISACFGIERLIKIKIN